MQLTPAFAELQVMPAREVFLPIASTDFGAIVLSTQLGEPLLPNVVVSKTNPHPVGQDFGAFQSAFLTPHRAAPKLGTPTIVQMTLPSGVLKDKDEPAAEAALGITANTHSNSATTTPAEPHLDVSLNLTLQTLRQAIRLVWQIVVSVDRRSRGCASTTTRVTGLRQAAMRLRSSSRGFQIILPPSSPDKRMKPKRSRS